MTKLLIDQAVDRFLQWKLPKDFAPDCGIGFKHLGQDPIGTNLFTAVQARAMLEEVVNPFITRIAELETQLKEADAELGLGEQTTVQMRLHERIIELEEKLNEVQNIEDWSLSVWWMHDNHSFTKLDGYSLSALVEQANRLAKEDPYGSLCPVIVKHKDKEVRRVGKMVYPEFDWEVGPSQWVNNLLADNQIAALLVP